MPRPTFSVVINTLNRGDLLARTLQSLRGQRYDGRFEVVVVDGPSTDNTAEVIEAWSARIRAGRCDVANLSISRNVGIGMAQGDVVAFIDDDAVPEPEWLARLADAYDSDEVGGAGGPVFDHTGRSFQYRYGIVDRFGTADLSPDRPTPHLCYPGSSRIPHLLGTNASFRRSALVEIGGFDEEFEYFLDETDVCLRIVDAGYLIVQVPSAYVHHKFAPSHIRDHNRVTAARYAVLKNKLYFSLKHGRPYRSLEAILADAHDWFDAHEKDVADLVGRGLLPHDAIARFAADRAQAWEAGIARGLAEDPDTRRALQRRTVAGTFLPFATLPSAGRRSIVLVTKDYPPGHGGGVATFNRDLAEALASEGHVVHVVTGSDDIDRVDFENGTWIHRCVPGSRPVDPGLAGSAVPQHLWDWSATARDEVARIAGHRAVDVVEAPIWDCEGIAFLADGRWPLVTSLQTTLHFWLESHAGVVHDPAWLEAFARPVLALERRLMREADAVRSISAAIRDEVERAYDFRFDERRLVVAPLGVADVRVGSGPARPPGEVVVLFVGRFESRKGIDVLLAAMPQVLREAAGVRFRLVGDDSLPGPGGATYRDAFLADAAGASTAGRVTFEGRLDDASLARAYAGCDVFVAPSRFESFGLVYLEAMREAKPVIGCRAGGVPEIVVDGTTGLLVPPGDPAALARAIVTLAGSASLRESMGRAGRDRFLAHFTRERMARASAALYDRAVASHAGARPDDGVRAELAVS